MTSPSPHMKPIAVLFRFFMLNGYWDLPNIYSVLSNERSGVEDCVQMLIQRGRKQIAFIVDQPTPSSRLKEQGYRNGLRHIRSKEGIPRIYSNAEGSLKGSRFPGCPLFMPADPQRSPALYFVCSPLQKQTAASLNCKKQNSCGEQRRNFPRRP